MNNIFTFFRESSMGRFLIPTGIIIIVFSIFTFISVNNSKDYLKTDAIITKLDLYEEAYTDTEGNHFEATYTVFVKYTVDNVEYESEYGVFSGYKKGDKVTIAYNPDNPKEITQPTSILFPIILLSLGIVSLVLGIISIIKAINKHKTLKLQEEGWSNGR